MKKVTLLTLADAREQALVALQRLGVMHLATTSERGEDAENLRLRLSQIDSALALLDSAAAAQPSTTAQPTSPPLSRETAAGAERAIDELMALQKEAREDAERLERLEAEIRQMAPFGEFDQAHIDAIERAGLHVALGVFAANTPIPAIEGGHIAVLCRDKQGVFAAIVSSMPIHIEGFSPLKRPERSLREAREMLGRLHAAATSRQAKILGVVPMRKAIATHRNAVWDRLLLVNAREGMAGQGPISCLQGYIPETKLPALRSAADQHGWGWTAAEPDPADTPPTLIEHPTWVRPIKAVTGVLGILPGYREVDIGAVFLIFFSIFFALLIGDAGYGALVLIGTAAARRRMRAAPSYPFTLFYLLGGVTVVWGVLTGTYFGIPTEALPDALLAVRLPWLTDAAVAPELLQKRMMKLCFFIGATHLTVAHLWNAVALFPSFRALAQVGWIALVWAMFLMAGRMVLQEPMSPLLVPALLAGLVLVVLFMTPLAQLKAKIIDHCMLPLTVVSCFVDIVSYLRLFAVGMASLQVAQSFNSMAAGLSMHPALRLPLFALILLAGHGLNIVLCALGILVHGVRLNTLEFSQHKGLEWNGFAYRPFRITQDDEH